MPPNQKEEKPVFRAFLLFMQSVLVFGFVFDCTVEESALADGADGGDVSVGRIFIK